MGLAWALDRRQPARLAVWASVLGIVGMAALLLSPGTLWDPIGIAGSCRCRVHGRRHLPGAALAARHARASLHRLAVAGGGAPAGGPGRGPPAPSWRGAGGPTCPC